MSHPQYPDLPPTPPGPPSAPFGQAPTSQAMSIWALVLSFLWCVPLAPLAAIALAITVLVKSKDGTNRGTGKAIAALIVSVVGIVTLVAGAIGGYALVKSDDFQRGFNDGLEESTGGFLKVGDCFTASDPNLPPTKDDVLPCDQPHASEVFHTFDLDDGDYPGEEAAASLAEEGCITEFASFVGVPFDQSELNVRYLYPIEAYWTLGDRSVQCLIETGEESTGSLANAAR